MNQFVQAVLAKPIVSVPSLRGFPHRGVIVLALFLAASWPGTLGVLTRNVLVDAFVQVSVFVAITLLIIYGSERLFGYSIGTALRRSRTFQVPLAALLGATPGCGGAIVVVAAYTTGHVRFGAVVATLVATMGDAAFLLIATRPDAAAVALPLALVAGTAVGMLVDRLEIQPRRNRRAMLGPLCPRIQSLRWRDVLYCLLATLGLPGGILLLTGVTIPAPFDMGLAILAMLGVAAGSLIWVFSPIKTMANPDDHPMSRCAEETAFITAWVIGAFLTYEYAVAFSGLDLEALFATVAPLLPLVAIAIGLLPGCGPQVLVTTLYITGLVPFAALMGNVISNDGDALFPAIALEPRAAILATLYSTIPALILAYLFHFGAPGFLN